MFTLFLAYIKAKHDTHNRLPGELFFVTGVLDFVSLFAVIAYIGSR